jgi:hypothetical protein
MVFSSALANTEPAMSAPPSTEAVQNVTIMFVCIIFS